MIAGLIIYALGMTIACGLMAMALQERREQLRKVLDFTVTQAAEIGRLQIEFLRMRQQLAAKGGAE